MAKRKQLPARTPEARENQLIAKAVNEVERRLDDGSISSQLLTVLLKLATAKYQLELEKLRSDIDLQHSKVQEIEDKSTSSDKYAKALAAFRSYKGDMDEDEDYYNEDYD